jgi:hypothetical protein
MKAHPLAANPDEYVQSLSGWQRNYVEALRAVILADGRFQERIKWGHLVYFLDGPTMLIRAEEVRVLFGFWRGKRMLDIEPRLAGGGKYELRTLELRRDTPFELATATVLVRKAAQLSQELDNAAVPIR